MLTLALNPILTNLVVVFFLVVCVSMILIVLIQRPQGGGLGGAFGAGGGSAGAGQTAFGTKTGDVLTWGTVGVFFVYLLVAIGLNFVARPDTSRADPAPALIDPATQNEPPAPEEPVDPPLPGRMDALDPDAAEGGAGETTPGVGLVAPEQTPEQAPEETPEVDPASAEAP